MALRDFDDACSKTRFSSKRIWKDLNRCRLSQMTNTNMEALRTMLAELPVDKVPDALRERWLAAKDAQFVPRR